MTKTEFKEARDALGMTQAQFATALHFNSDRYIRELESGRRNVTPRTAQAVKTLLKAWGHIE